MKDKLVMVWYDNFNLLWLFIQRLCLLSSLYKQFNMIHFIFQLISFPPSGILQTHNDLLSSELY